MCHTGFMSAAMDSWSGGFRVNTVIFPPCETRSPAVCIQKRWLEILVHVFLCFANEKRGGVGWGAALCDWRGKEGLDGSRRKALQKERWGKKEKWEQTHDTKRKGTRGTRRENGKNEGGSLLPANRWPPQFTAAPIRDPEGQLFAPPGYRRCRKGRGPARLNTDRRERPLVSVPAFVLLTRQQKGKFVTLAGTEPRARDFPRAPL